MFVSLQFKLELKKVLTHLIPSLQSESSGCEGANGRNSTWQVLKVALLFPILGKVLPISVEVVWDKVRSRLLRSVPMRDFLEQPG